MTISEAVRFAEDDECPAAVWAAWEEAEKGVTGE